MTSLQRIWGKEGGELESRQAGGTATTAGFRINTNAPLIQPRRECISIHVGRSCSRGQSSTAPRLFRSFQNTEAPEQAGARPACGPADAIRSSFRGR
ncbi:hypothetical protein FQN60_002412 [Etheostoma spectabile]|uniref:Uncharacterized protein n=1 Tax=Etheostoma spectabile TaxID=54343 RepID=A0A5J5DCD0_9PERO|nr:hypothetical protein FQN60_002412 [Etheostoma spectabile]